MIKDADLRSRGFARRIFDKLPNSGKNKEQERQRKKLLSDFVAKATGDIEKDGFTERRRMEGSGGLVNEALNSRVVYVNGNRRYEVFLSSRTNKPGDSLSGPDCIEMNLTVEDVVDSPTVSVGTKRTGSVSKSIDLSLQNDPNTDRTERESVLFDQKVMKNGQSESILGDSGSNMSLSQAIVFLQELLASYVDPYATQEDFRKSQEDKSGDLMSYWRVVDTYWNRERPGEIQRFFAAAQSSAVSPA